MVPEGSAAGAEGGGGTLGAATPRPLRQGQGGLTSVPEAQGSGARPGAWEDAQEVRVSVRSVGDASTRPGL